MQTTKLDLVNYHMDILKLSVMITQIIIKNGILAPYNIICKSNTPNKLLKHIYNNILSNIFKFLGRHIAESDAECDLIDFNTYKNGQEDDNYINHIFSSNNEEFKEEFNDLLEEFDNIIDLLDQYGSLKDGFDDNDDNDEIFLDDVEIEDEVKFDFDNIDIDKYDFDVDELDSSIILNYDELVKKGRITALNF